MKEVKISERLVMRLPDDYKKVPLPGLTTWVAALRSGQYAQGKGYLNSEGGYCCLGVLCEVQLRPKYLYNVGLSRYGYDNDEVGLSLRNPLCELLGDYGYFPSSVTGTLAAGDGESGSTATALSDLNDDGVPFSDIVTVLELLWCEPEVANG